MSKRRKNPASKSNARAAAAVPKRVKLRDIFVARPFEGLADEAEWIALRELVPAATAPLTLVPELAAKHSDRTVVLASVLPGAAPAMSRADGTILIGLQRHQQSGDISRDLAAALISALETEPGTQVVAPSLPGEGPRLPDVIVDGELEVTVHDGFGFWLAEGAGDDPQTAAVLDQANAAIFPTVRLAARRGAYWCLAGDKAHVRLVLTDDEDHALAALARLAAAGELALGEGTRFAGMFRAHGRLAPVWDLPADVEAGQWEASVTAFADRYAKALADGAPVTADERRARQGLLGRQLALR
ncbi:DUF5926 family protein [Pilimelia columellifera]|uniref:DUF5926 family protein n=1 Tax=Pilimelia columellifera subsp. columellifera TaxID=706583 RepID=A0ABN3NBB8_9ACTN